MKICCCFSSSGVLFPFVCLMASFIPHWVVCLRFISVQQSVFSVVASSSGLVYSVPLQSILPTF